MPRRRDPALWAEWDAYRRAPDAPRPPVALSNLLIAMAPHVSRFLTRLFAVDTPASAIEAATQAQDDLFRFKVDFVRRRALPLLKNGAHVAATPEDDAIVAALIAKRVSRRPRARDRESRLRAARRRKRQQRRALGPWPRDRGTQAMVCLEDSRPRLSRLGDLPLPRERRAVPPGRGRAAGSRDCPRRWSARRGGCGDAMASP